MRHGKKINHLGRTTAHRHAMLSNMATSLILHKRVTTTVAKAKDDTTHSRRTVFATLQNKESMKELFGEVAARIANRPGGYTRILKLSATRQGDNADMCIIELVDFNETLLEAKNATEAKSTTTRRSRRRGGKSGAEADSNETGTSAAVVADAPAATTTESAPADTDTETLTNGETREDAEKAE